MRCDGDDWGGGRGLWFQVVQREERGEEGGILINKHCDSLESQQSQ
jgi:hypothetical protein